MEPGQGVRGAYGKQANYWWVWLPLALAFAAAFWRTDKLFAIRNLDIVALLGSSSRTASSG